MLKDMISKIEQIDARKGWEVWICYTKVRELRISL